MFIIASKILIYLTVVLECIPIVLLQIHHVFAIAAWATAEEPESLHHFRRNAAPLGWIVADGGIIESAGMQHPYPEIKRIILKTMRLPFLQGGVVRIPQPHKG